MAPLPRPEVTAEDVPEARLLVDQGERQRQRQSLALGLGHDHRSGRAARPLVIIPISFFPSLAAAMLVSFAFREASS
jgi:hypothetical protein